MATILPSSPLAWLPPIQTQLVAATALPVERVNFTIRDMPPMGNIQDLLIWPREIVNYASITLGSGRVAPTVTRNVHIIVRTRLATDQAESDQNILLDPALGHIQLEDNVYGALLDFQPVDTDGNTFLVCPMGFVSGPWPFKPAAEGIPDLAQSVITFDATYILNQAAVNDGVNL